MERSTSMATIAGVLDIIAGISSLVGAGALFILAVVGTGAIGVAAAQEPEAAPVALLPLVLFGSLALLCLAIGLFAVVGGVAAIRRRKMWLAIVGAIAALFAFFPLGIPAIILTVLAEKDFRRPIPPTQLNVES